MVKRNIIKDTYINTIIGAGTRFKGNIELEGLIRIDGDYVGTLQNKGRVIVGNNGRVDGVIKADTITIGGIVRGNIFASKLIHLLSTSIIIGRIYTPGILAEEGMCVSGECYVDGAKSIEHLFDDFNAKQFAGYDFYPKSSTVDSVNFSA